MSEQIDLTKDTSETTASTLRSSFYSFMRALSTSFLGSTDPALFQQFVGKEAEDGSLTCGYDTFPAAVNISAERICEFKALAHVLCDKLEQLDIPVTIDYRETTKAGWIWTNNDNWHDADVFPRVSFQVTANNATKLKDATKVLEDNVATRACAGPEVSPRIRQITAHEFPLIILKPLGVRPA